MFWSPMSMLINYYNKVKLKITDFKNKFIAIINTL